MFLIIYFILNFFLLSFDVNIKKQLIKDTKLYSDSKNIFLVSSLKKNSYVYILKEFSKQYYVKTLDSKKGYVAKDSLKEFIVKDSIGYLISSKGCNIFADKEFKHLLGLTTQKEKFLIESYESLDNKKVFKTIYNFYIVVEEGQYLFKKEKNG